MLEIRCTSCDATIYFPESFVGKSGRCQICQQPFVALRSAPENEGEQIFEIVSNDDRFERPDESEDVLEIIDDGDESIFLESDDDPLRISVEPGSPDVPREILGKVSEAIRDHLTASPDGTFRETDLSLSIDMYEPGSQFMRYMFPILAGAARVTMSMTGTVNGTPVDTSTRAARYWGVFGGNSQSLLTGCLKDCICNILLEIDAASGREPLPFARFWRRWQIDRWVVVAGTAATYAAVCAGLHLSKAVGNGRDDWEGIMFGGSLITALSTLGVATLGPMVFAPRKFLLNDPRGMRIMSRVGANSTEVMRVIAAVISLISIGGVLMALAMMMGKP
jgi:hypothetical protein